MVKDNSKIFKPELLKKLPLTYHFMIEQDATKVSELNLKTEFSTSKKHQSDKYPTNNINYKPISFILNEDEKSI